MWKKHTDVSSVLALVKIVVASQHKKRQQKKYLSTFVDNWKRKLVHALNYANELLLRVRFAFQKLLLRGAATVAFFANEARSTQI